MFSLNNNKLSFFFTLQSGLQHSKVKKLKEEYEAWERDYQVKIDKLETDEKKLMSDLYSVCEKYKDLQEIVLDKELMGSLCFLQFCFPSVFIFCNIKLKVFLQ